jgi:hypothetical protein
MRFSLVCISSITLRSTMDQSGSQRTSFQFSIDAYRPNHVSRLVKPGNALRRFSTKPVSNAPKLYVRNRTTTGSSLHPTAVLAPVTLRESSITLLLTTPESGVSLSQLANLI